MKYDKIEKVRSRRNMENTELGELAKLYVCSDSISEFTLKAATAGLDKFGLIKWFRLFYFLKNNSMYDGLLWYVLSVGFIISSVCIWLTATYLPVGILGGAWKCLTVLFISVLCIVSTLIITRYVTLKMERIKEIIWKME